MSGKTWLVTGCATGFGRTLAEMALARGDRVAATDRSLDAVLDLASRYPDSTLALGLDVTKPAEVHAGVDAAFAHFRRIDVIVNNAGYGVQAAVEEADMAEVRSMFEVNLFGMIEMIRAALPHLRAQGAGHIVNFASVAGRVAGPLMGLYAASKFAVEGLSEGLAAEVAPLGIKVTTIEPGAFATKFDASAVLPKDPLPAYDPIRRQMHALIEGLPWGNPGDLAGAILELADAPEPPRQFIGGPDAYLMVESSLKAQVEEMERWRELSTRANTAAINSDGAFKP